MKILITTLLFSIAVISSFGNDAFPITRRNGLASSLWGAAGGIPTGQTVYTNVPLLTAANLTTVINNCPSNQVIVLSNVTYDLGAAKFHIKKNGVVLRGSTNSSGYPTTTLDNGAVWIGTSGANSDGTGTWPSESWASHTAITINSGYTEGSTSITLASAPGADFIVGDIALIDQTDDGTLVINSTVAQGRRTGRNYNMLIEITSISGSDVGFQPPLVGSYWAAAQTPQLVAWRTTAGATYRKIGLENCIINPDVELYNCGIGRAYGCWMKNIKTHSWPTGGGGSGVHFRQVVSCSLVDSILTDGPEAENSSYAVYLAGISFCAIENNIFTNLPLAMPTINAVGCSFSYNISFGPSVYSPTTWNPEYFFPHGGHSFMNLWEGNWLLSPIYMDATIYGGNNSRNGIVRNRLVGWLSGKTGNTLGFGFEANMDTNTILGNILGMEGYHTTYASTFSIDGTCLGNVMTNNYNVGDDGINSAETMSVDTMLDSYRYMAAPTWWGDLQWPSYPVSSVSTNVLYYTNSPAGFRSYFGQWPSGVSGGQGTSGIKRPIKGIRLKGIRR